MKLYHGTAGRLLPEILERGIEPRGDRSSNWEKFPSRRDLVYLTTAYPIYFAMKTMDDSDDRFAVVEVDSELLPHKRLYPDEDFIAQALAHQRKCTIEDCHDEVRAGLEGYRHHWRDSIEGLGNVAYCGSVPVEAITRVSTVELGKQKHLLFASDPSISLLNYKFCGEKYRSLVAWLFGDREDYQVGYGPNEATFAMMEPLQPGHTAAMRAVFANREGIEVYSPQEARR